MKEKEEKNVKISGKDIAEVEYEELLMLNMTGLFSKLPGPIILDILSRVPLKSLSQCRWVCKTWLDIISLPRFAEMQFANGIQNRCPPFIFVHVSRKNFLLLDNEFLVDYRTSTTALQLERKGLDEALASGNKPTDDELLGSTDYYLVGAVNGLICFLIYYEIDDRHRFRFHNPWSSEHPYYIWNPITGEYITLPESASSDMYAAVSNFGFDSVKNEYKVIRIIQDKHFKSKAEIFTLGSDAWREIENIPYLGDIQVNQFEYSNVFVNGNLHLLCNRARELYIVSFNVGAEVFHEIEPPNATESKVFQSLGVMEDCLCFFVNDFEDCNEIWVMKEYGVHDSWIKEYALVKGVLSWSDGKYDVIKLRNGELLLLRHYAEDIYYYNEYGYYHPNTKTFKKIELQGLSRGDRGQWLWPLGITGSLFSPKNCQQSKG